MNKQIIINEFTKIKEMKWVKSSNTGSSSIGTTFENLLGIEKNTFSFPDYYGIEIKTKRKECFNKYITIITSNPCKINHVDLQLFVNKFGYPDKSLPNFNVLHHSSNYTSFNNLGIKYKTTIFINYDTETIHLLFYNKHNYIIEYNMYWTFKELYERIINKIETLALVEAERKIVDNIEYFKYTNLSLYKLKKFNYFLSCIENGTIRISLKLGIYKTGILTGHLYNHGISFQILEKDLNQLFEKIY